MSERVYKHKYSAEQDATILESKRGDFDRLASRFGVTKSAVLNRRKYLQRRVSPFESYRREVIINRAPPPFARPAWFDENLEVLSRGSKPFISRLTQ